MSRRKVAHGGQLFAGGVVHRAVLVERAAQHVLQILQRVEAVDERGEGGHAVAPMPQEEAEEASGLEHAAHLDQARPVEDESVVRGSFQVLSDVGYARVGELAVRLREAKHLPRLLQRFGDGADVGLRAQGAAGRRAGGRLGEAGEMRQYLRISSASKSCGRTGGSMAEPEQTGKRRLNADCLLLRLVI